ncbi:MAG: hypothetical protein FWH10_09015 [Oscillospiraceae bacterium]|nr:hypothetical protein [Oscillospiraceae bacterium]
MIDFISDNIIAVLIITGILLLIIIISAAKSGKKKRARNSQNIYSGRETNVMTEAVSKRNISYEPIIEIARAITDNDSPTIEKMRLLARNFPEFVTQNSFWCESVVKRVSSSGTILDKKDKDALTANFFAYWLNGHSVGSGGESNPSGKFACYIRGDENPKELIAMLEQVSRTLNCGLEFKNIPLAGIGSVTALIPVVNSTLSYRRYTLLSFETGSDRGFYLFITQMKDHDKIIQSAQKVNFKIYRQIMI